MKTSVLESFYADLTTARNAGIQECMKLCLEMMDSEQEKVVSSDALYKVGVHTNGILVAGWLKEQMQALIV